MNQKLFQREIQAPVEVVFDLCRSIDFHLEAAHAIHARAVGGQRSGLAQEGTETVYSARFWGCRFRLRMQISHYHPPNELRDEMVRGLFAHFSHHYLLTATEDGCLLQDTFSFELPGGSLLPDWSSNLLARTLHQAQDARLNAIQERAEQSLI